MISNTSNTSIADVTKDSIADMDVYLPMVPTPFRRWLQYDCPDNMDVQSLVEAHQRYGEPWSVIWRNIANMARRGHAEIFGDPTLWRRFPEEGIRQIKRNEMPTMDDFLRSGLR